MLITIALCAVALCVGWVVGSARARERVAIADQARAVAEARVADVKRMENAFAATAQRFSPEVASSIVQQHKVQADGSLETKKAEIVTMLEPLNQMLFDYRG